MNDHYLIMALHAAISRRSWNEAERAANRLRDERPDLSEDGADIDKLLRILKCARDEGREALDRAAAAEARLAEAVGPDYVVVPREPTKEMLHAATLEVPTWDDDASRRKYKAMLSRVGGAS